MKKVVANHKNKCDVKKNKKMCDVLVEKYTYIIEGT